MTLIYIEVEGTFGAELLRRVLPAPLLEVTKISASTNSYGVISGARTLLVKRKRPVVAIVDFHPDNGPTVRSQLYLVRELLYAASPGVACEAFIAYPEIEALLVQEQAVLEHLVQRPVTADEWQAARQAPRAMLTQWLGSPQALRETVQQLPADMVQRLRQQRLIRDLIAFLEEAIAEQEQEEQTTLTPAAIATP